MTRIFVDKLPVADNRGYLDPKHSERVSDPNLIELDSELTHHLRDVLRLDEGKQLTVVCRESGLEYLAIIAIASKNSPLKIKLIERLDRTVAIPIVSSLACGLPKGSHADQICEQVSQLGVSNIIFWCAERSIVQPKQAAAKLERWQKIAEAAARQSKQNTIPKVSYLNSSPEFYSWININCSKDFDTLAVCSLSPLAQAITSVKAPSGRAHLVVGPEGDFSDNELKMLDGLGARQVSLGPLVLRVETAAVVGVSMALAAWGWR